MNEQIRQLAIQADIGFDEKYHWYVSNKTLEKFAELIVKECILTVQRGITRDGNTTEKCLRSMTHIKDIKQHFGVEE